MLILMVRRKSVVRRKKKVTSMNCDPETHTKMMKHNIICLGSFLLLLGAFPLMGYRWEYVAILFGAVTIFKSIFMKKCC
jgi:hypothetical protein